MDSTSRVILFFEKCRLCLDNAGEWNMFEDDSFPQAVYDCTGVKVSPSDNLPQKICLICFDTILNAKELRILAMRNDSHIRALFDEENNDMIITNTKQNTCKDSRTDDRISEEPTPGPSRILYFRHKTKNLNSRKRSLSSNELDSSSSKSKAAKSISVRKDLFQTSEVSSSNTSTRNADGEVNGTKKKKKTKLDRESELECGECGKTFETQKKLYLHQRLHNKSRACPFDACGKMFATKNDLSKHVRTHTGEKPYSCDICDKSFTQQGTLKIHRETVHYKITL